MTNSKITDLEKKISELSGKALESINLKTNYEEHKKNMTGIITKLEDRIITLNAQILKVMTEQETPKPNTELQNIKSQLETLTNDITKINKELFL
jgi:predicted  nucleic acid-binding Zn-ribbon protein